MKTTKSLILPIILAALIITSCSDYDNGYTEKTIRYERAFYDAFGQIDPNQDWNLVKQLRNKNGGGMSTRGASPNSNQWEDWGYVVPGAITDDELAAVLEVFNQKGEESYESLIDWHDFFVQQVYCGPEGNKMTELATVVEYTVNVNVTSWDPYEADTIYTIVDPFDDIVNDLHGNVQRSKCMLMLNSATLEWSFKSTQGGGERFYNFRMEYIPGYGYYIGFDFQSNRQADANDNEYFERDYIYNDWIIKVVPAHGETPDPPTDIPTPPDKPDPEPTEEILEAGLLCCEDMGGAEADFDFNDIVLKLEHKRRTATENGETSTKDIFVVTAMAAGGTLPSYVFYKPLKDAETLNLEWGDQWMNEAMKSDGWVPFKTEDDDVSNGIHDMWDAKDLSGQTTFEPLNVDQKFKGEGHSWEVDVTAAIDLLKTYTNADEEQQERIRHYADHYVSYVFDRIRIRVYVDPVMNADGSVNIASPNSNYIEPIYHGMHESGEYSDYRDAERPPQMILLPLRFEWPTESTFIGEAYEYFTEWVRDTGKTDWYLYKTSDDHVTSRDVDGEELQPRLRWGAIDDGTEEIYMSVTLTQGKSMTIPFTTLSGGGFTTSSSDQNVAYATNVNATSKEITIAANNPGTATITLTQDATSLYRAENIMLYVTVEGNGVTPEPEPEPQPGEGEYTEVQVNTDSYDWGHTIIKSQSSTFGKDYPYGALVKIVFSETPSNLRVYNGDPLNTSWTANSKEFIFELTDIDMMKLANKALTIEFDKMDANVKMYIKPKTAEEVYGTIAEWTYSNKVEGDDQYNYSNVYTVSAGSLANCTAGTIITFVAEMYCNYKYYIGNYQQSGNWQFGNSGYLKITLTADQAAEARKSGIRLLTSSTLSNPQIYIKSAGSNAKKRRTARR